MSAENFILQLSDLLRVKCVVLSGNFLHFAFE